MAYGGGIFVPSETAYKDPNRFRDVLQAEGNKEATYLADMDQFFAQLEEMKRQFDITAEMKDRQFEETLAFEQSKLDWQSGENELDRALKRYEIGESTKLGYANIEANKEIAKTRSGDTALEWAKFGLEQEAQKYNISTNEFMKNLYLNQQSRSQESHDILVNAVGGEAGSGGSSGVSGVSGSYYNPFSPSQNISDYLGDYDSGGSIEESYKQFGDWY